MALFSDGQPIAAVEEEKLSRGAGGDGLPLLALDYCLRQAGARPADVAAVALTGRPKQAWFREQRLRFDLLASGAGIDEHSWPSGTVIGKLKRTQMLRRMMGPTVPFQRFEHHLCHAASAFFASPFDDGLVLTLDGSGDMWSGLVSSAEGDRIKPLHTLRFPNSLGWLYSRITELLGFRPGSDEQKTQWLSATGAPPHFLPSFRRLFKKDDRGLPLLNRQFLTADAGGTWKLSSAFTQQLELTDGLVPERSLQAAIARSVQEFIEQTVVDIAETYRLRTQKRDLCLAGGVFLNVLLVRALEQRTGFSRVFVQPVANNAGTALGAAWLASHRIRPTTARAPLAHLHLGPQFDPAEIKAVLESCKLTYAYVPRTDQLLAATVAELARGKMVAWYQDRMEFGFRALGNRSIVASPFAPYAAENLNHYLKRREDFHPFVLSVPAERAAAFFDSTPNCRFAASVGDVRAGHPELQRLAFAGSRVRLHIVERSVNPLFHDLLQQFGRSAPAPVLVNTSFNLFGEPLVCDPRTAIRSFYCSGIDALVMDRFLVIK